MRLYRRAHSSALLNPELDINANNGWSEYLVIIMHSALEERVLDVIEALYKGLLNFRFGLIDLFLTKSKVDASDFSNLGYFNQDRSKIYSMIEILVF